MEPQAIMLGRQMTLDVSEKYNNVTKVDGDKAITESTIRELVKVLLKYTDDYSAKRQLNDLQAYPIDSAKCRAAIQLVNDAPFIEIVPAAENYHEESGLYLFVWERCRAVFTDTILAQDSDDGVNALGARQQEIGLRITVSQSAWDAMGRHANALREQEVRQEQQRQERAREQELRRRQLREQQQLLARPYASTPVYDNSSYYRSKDRGCNLCTII